MSELGISPLVWQVLWMVLVVVGGGRKWISYIKDGGTGPTLDRTPVFGIQFKV